ncbi:MAG: fructose-1,6-bisphosphatase [Chitinivibrionia bacterium]|nr:fructose-1,6-bisphosphatase [Chitinivibrionia bacterium]
MNYEYLKLLSGAYPSIDSVCTEIINLQAIMSLPKGTEHFISDIHGEYEAFNHILRNSSGIIRSKLERLFDREMTEKQIRELATLIYYPKEKLALVRKKNDTLSEWYELTLNRLIRFCAVVSQKYTRSKVRKALPKEFAYIIDELIYEHGGGKESYYNNIIEEIIALERADEFIIALAETIQAFAVDHLHILGDIFDRGPLAHKIMDKLANHHHKVDIQWGNHDVVWMGAAAGSDICVAEVLRISLRYGNFLTIEQGYGISLRPLAVFAMKTYEKDECEMYFPKDDGNNFSETEKRELAKMHKAISVIRFKLEGELVARRPKWGLEDRLLLSKIDYEKNTILIDGTEYPLKDKEGFCTIDPNNPYELTADERELMVDLVNAFAHSGKLQFHTRFLFSHGSMYLCMNDNLLFPGCIPLNRDGTLRDVDMFGQSLKGKALLDAFDKYARRGFFATDKNSKLFGQDLLWYLWSGANSPIFAKDKMATFERYYIDNKTLQNEEKDPYYDFRDNEEVCDNILREFGLQPEYSHIVNGHIPVKVKKGEKPSKANGKLMVIDGGFSKAYQSVTGIAGYTLIFNSWGMSLISHEPFTTTEEAILHETDIVSTRDIVEYNQKRILIRDTDNGFELGKKIDDLRELLEAYRKGIIVEAKTYDYYSRR